MSRMKIWVTAVFGVIAICLSGVAEARELRIGTEAGYPPWNLTDSSGAIVGYEVDMINEICKSQALACELVPQAWEGVIPGLKTGKFDAIMSGISITEERAKVFDFSRSYASVPSRFFAKKSAAVDNPQGPERINLATLSESDETSIQALRSALQGKTVGIIAPTVQSKFLDQYFADTVTVKIYEKQDSLILDLLADRVDVAFSDVTTWIAALKEHPEITAFGPSFSGGIFGKGVGIGVPKGQADLLQKFNTGIDELSSKGSLRQMSVKWFGFDVTPNE